MDPKPQPPPLVVTRMFEPTRVERLARHQAYTVLLPAAGPRCSIPTAAADRPAPCAPPRTEERTP